MARTRKIDELDQVILDIMKSLHSPSLKDIVYEVNLATMKNHKEPTIRYRLEKLRKMGEIRRKGICGWGKSYGYQYITDEDRVRIAKEMAAKKMRMAFSEDLKAMLKAVGISICEYANIDRDGDIEVNAKDLARILRENYEFETVYEEEENEVQSQSA